MISKSNSTSLKQNFNNFLFDYFYSEI